MQVYGIQRITGYYLGTIMNPQWTKAEPVGKCLPLWHQVDRYPGIGRAYENYLYRLGQNTFNKEYQTPRRLGYEGPLCEFVAGHWFKIFPWRHTHFDPVAASPSRFSVISTPKNYPDREITSATRRQGDYNLFLRYKERVWWGKAIFYSDLGFIGYHQGQELQGKLMFEKRERGKKPSKNDIWSFGMAWFESHPTYLGSELYVWQWANLLYVGLGHRTAYNTGRVWIGKV